MATVNRSIAPVSAQPRAAVGAPRFDWVVTLLSAWMIAGLFVDGWAHTTAKPETFFTPWHGVLYTGFAVLASWLAAKGMSRTLPAAYLLALAGAGVFLMAGVGDLVWHELFGIESGTDALLSPTHLGLAFGGVLLVSGPLRAAGARRAPPRGWTGWLPPLLSATWTLSIVIFITQFASPLAQTGSANDYVARFGTTDPGQEISGMLLQTGIAVGLLLLLARRWRLPFGAWTLVLGLNATLMTLMTARYLSPGPLPLITAATIAGLAADVLARRQVSWRVTAIVTPVILHALYFTAITVWGGGIAWSIHLWAGAIVMTGIAGLLVSYLIDPPRALQPVEA